MKTTRQTLGEFLETLDLVNPIVNKAELVIELGLSDFTHVTVDESEAQIVYKVSSFTIAGRLFPVGFNEPGTCDVAVLLYKFAQELEVDEFLLTTELLQIVRRYFGDEAWRRALVDTKLYDVPLKALLQGGNHQVSIQRK